MAETTSSMYSGLQPAIIALMATFSAVTDICRWSMQDTFALPLRFKRRGQALPHPLVESVKPSPTSGTVLSESENICQCGRCQAEM
jgi:hypothetical protein